MKKGFFLIFLTIFFVFAPFAHVKAQINRNSINGYWQTYNDKTGKPAGIMKIWQYRGKFYGKLIKIYGYNPNNSQLRCARCRGKRRNRPSLCLTILRGLVFSKGKYRNGRILDPRNGKEYRINIKVIKGGRALELRGYVGLPLLGRTMIWPRMRKPQTSCQGNVPII